MLYTLTTNLNIAETGSWNLELKTISSVLSSFNFNLFEIIHLSISSKDLYFLLKYSYRILHLIFFVIPHGQWIY